MIHQGNPSEVSVVVVIVNLCSAGGANSPQLVDNLSGAKKEDLHLRRCFWKHMQPWKKKLSISFDYLD